MTTIASLNADFKKAIKTDPYQFVLEYLKNEEAVLQLLESFDGIKSEIYLHAVDKKLDEYLGYSSLFSDITLLNMASSKVNDSHMAFFEPGHEFYKERKLTIPASKLLETGVDPSKFYTCYAYRNRQESKELFSKYKTFLESEKLLIRPLRSLYVSKGEDNNLFYYVNPNTPNEHWEVDDNKQYDFVTIDNGIGMTGQQALFEITVPFINGLEMSKFAKIVNEETEILSIFRSELKKVVKGILKEEGSIKEFTQDTLRPELTKLERKFKRIQSAHKLGVGVTVGAFSLTLILGNLMGANIVDSLSKFGPAAIATGAINEKAYQNNMDELRDNPYYLLWRLKRTK